MTHSALRGKAKGFPLGCRGISAMGCLAFILIAGGIGYVGFKVGGAYWSFLEVRHKTQEVLNWAVVRPPKSEPDIVRRVIANAAEVGVELSLQNIQITQTTETMTIIVSWVHEVEFPYYTLPLHFTTTQTEQKRWIQGGLVVKDKP